MPHLNLIAQRADGSITGCFMLVRLLSTAQMPMTTCAMHMNRDETHHLAPSDSLTTQKSTLKFEKRDYSQI